MSTEGNFLEAKAALYFGSGTIFLKRQILFHSAHLLVPAWTGQSAQFCKATLYFQSGTIFFKRKSFGTKKLPSDVARWELSHPLWSCVIHINLRGRLGGRRLVAFKSRARPTAPSYTCRRLSICRAMVLVVRPEDESRDDEQSPAYVPKTPF